MQVTIVERRHTPSKFKIIVDNIDLLISGRVGEPFTVKISGTLCREDGEIYIPKEKKLRKVK